MLGGVALLVCMRLKMLLIWLQVVSSLSPFIMTTLLPWILYKIKVWCLNLTLLNFVYTHPNPNPNQTTKPHSKTILTSGFWSLAVCTYEGEGKVDTWGGEGWCLTKNIKAFSCKMAIQKVEPKCSQESVSRGLYHLGTTLAPYVSTLCLPDIIRCDWISQAFLPSSFLHIVSNQKLKAGMALGWGYRLPAHLFMVQWALA